MEKALVRREMLKKRRSLPEEWVQQESRKIVRKLLDWDMLQQSKTCMLFLSMPEEPQLDELIEKMIEQGKTICVPRLSSEFGVMDAAQLNALSQAVPGKKGVRQPADTCERIEPEQIDTVLIPGVAFDLAGTRLGMGAGYYDRYLTRIPRAMFIGIAWDFQIMDKLPAAEHDVPVMWVVTENSLYDCKRCCVFP